MIQQESLLKIIDNSGAKLAKCIKVPNGFRRRYASLGDVVIVSIQQLRNKSKSTSKVSKGGVFRAVVLRVKKLYKSKDGSCFSLGENAAVLVSKQGTPIGTRILGPIPKILKKKKFMKFVSLCVGLV